MQTDFINEIIPTPTLKTGRCRTVALILKLILQYLATLIAATAWYFYDYFVGGATFLLAMLVMGIIKSYLRNSVIPHAQQEYNYSDKEIADWYTARELCIELSSKTSLQKSED